MYFEVIEQLNQVLQNVVNELTEDAPEVYFSPARDTQHGDFATNAAMVLAKPLKKNPREIAGQIVTAMNESGLVASAEMAGPGFINIRIKPDVFVGMLKSILQTKDEYGKSTKYQGKKALVEYVSANPTGPLHVGHVRGAIVGDMAAELLEAVGYDVTREYYYNDAGVQMQMLGLSVRARYRQLFDLETPLPENGYRGDYIRTIAAALRQVKGDELKNEENWKPFTEFASGVIMIIIMDDLRKLRVKFDTTFSEYTLHSSGAVKDTLAELKEKGATYEKEDAVWLRTTEHGDEKDRVLVKKDGEPTYVTPDIAYHRDKYNRGVDLMVNVMGHDHHSQVERVKIALGMFGYDLNKLEYLLNQMVSISRGGEKIKLSTRSGDFMTLSDMVDELGADVTRYFFAQRSYNSQMVFDWDLAKEEKSENPAYYLQYLHARACSLESKALENGYSISETLDVDHSVYEDDLERNILLKLFFYPAVVMDAAEKRETHLLPDYLEDLAKMFHHYYHEKKVIHEDVPKEIGQARLQLYVAARQVMRNGLRLLKVSAPERM